MIFLDLPEVHLDKREGVIYRYFKIFRAWGSRHQRSWLDLDGLLRKMLQCAIWRRKMNRYFWVSVAFGEKSKVFSSTFSQGWRWIWYNTNGYCLRKAGKNESFNIARPDCDWVRHLWKIKAERDCKKDRQISRKYFKGDTSQPNHRSGRASLWKGLSLCRRV